MNYACHNGHAGKAGYQVITAALRTTDFSGKGWIYNQM
jgi:hypothetical protein